MEIECSIKSGKVFGTYFFPKSMMNDEIDGMKLSTSLKILRWFHWNTQYVYGFPEVYELPKESGKQLCAKMHDYYNTIVDWSMKVRG